MTPKSLAAAIALALPAAAHGVYLNPDGHGQALIYPYFTAQAVSGNAFNTYISIVNQAADAKALRVRFREGRNGVEVGSFNLFLASKDMWTGAVVPAGIGTTLVTRDTSCVQGRFAVDFSAPPGAPTLDFRNTLYAGANTDGLGEGLERTREGWVEVIEMAAVTGALATGIAHNSAGFPANCGVASSPSASDIAAPTGGLSGTLTLINVASGEDFTVNAEALAELSTRSFFRPSSDTYPDLNALEIEPVSVVASNGFVYRSTWNRGADAVSATLMRSTFMGEFVLDPGTQSRSDMVVSYPTRQFYRTGASLVAPFATCTNSNTFGGQPATIHWYSREAFGATHQSFDGIPPPPVTNFRCSATTVLGLRSASPHTQPVAVSGVLGSENLAVAEGAASTSVDNGWFEVTPTSNAPLTSLPSSTRTNIANGIVTAGAHAFGGVPAVGFTVRTFVNGTLACSGGACQGNYGGAFPLKFRRTITP